MKRRSEVENERRKKSKKEAEEEMKSTKEGIEENDLVEDGKEEQEEIEATTKIVVEDENEEETEKEEKKREVKFNVKHLEDNSLVRFCRNFIPKEEAASLFNDLMKLNFEQGDLKLYGKNLKTPRLQSWMADSAEKKVKKLFQKQPAVPWSKIPKMVELKSQIEEICKCKFDYVLVNLYRDGNDYIGFHADREAIKEGKNIIASVSLGETRRFLFRHKKKKELDVIEYALSNGSLIIMEGETQKYWKHSIPKEKKVTKPRINLTFRIE